MACVRVLGGEGRRRENCVCEVAWRRDLHEQWLARAHNRGWQTRKHTQTLRCVRLCSAGPRPTVSRLPPSALRATSLKPPSTLTMRLVRPVISATCPFRPGAGIGV